jgi:hypothetical protein
MPSSEQARTTTLTSPHPNASSRDARRGQDRSQNSGIDRAHHFDLPDPERKHAAPIAVIAERTQEPGTQKDLMRSALDQGD